MYVEEAGVNRFVDSRVNIDELDDVSRPYFVRKTYQLPSIDPFIIQTNSRKNIRIGVLNIST